MTKYKLQSIKKCIYGEIEGKSIQKVAYRSVCEYRNIIFRKINVPRNKEKCNETIATKKLVL